MAAKKDKSKLRIIPLGGLGEIGKNITVFEYGDDMIVVDIGSIFPREDMPGVDLVIPDTTYIEKNISKLRGYVITTSALRLTYSRSCPRRCTVPESPWR